MSDLRVPPAAEVYSRKGSVVLFNQLALKIEMDTIGQDDYYAWLDRMTATISDLVPGAQIAEKDGARVNPPLNIAVYYDTSDYQILPTGALLRTSCNRITHAFCAYKGPEDEHAVRADYRYVFDGDEKRTIQVAPTSREAVAIVSRLLHRTDIEHPGTYLERYHGISPRELIPAVRLDDLRYTFFVWLDRRDALRCSIDRAVVADMRLPESEQRDVPVGEVELAIYPHIEPEMADDERVVSLIRVLADDLCTTFGVPVTKKIKYQRAAEALGIARPAGRS